MEDIQTRHGIVSLLLKDDRVARTGLRGISPSWMMGRMWKKTYFEYMPVGAMEVQ